MISADLRWLLTQAVAKLPAGNVLFIDADPLAQAMPSERPDIHPVSFSSAREAWLTDKLPALAGVCMGFNPAKELVRMQLAMLTEQLPIGTKLWLYGAGRSGISSAPQLLKGQWDKIEKVAYGGHAELWHAVLRETAPARGIEHWQHRHLVEVAGQELVLVSLPGVFSHGEVDEGTRLLLEHLPLLPKGARVHDFGSGCGIIAAWLKRRQPDLIVSASDINALAHAATKATLKANEIFDVVCHVQAGLGKLPGPFDVIVSNPPFHTGQKTDLQISAELFASAARQLRPKGSIYVVANRFLPYRDAMATAIGKTEVLADNRQFWVLAARKS